MSKPMTPEERAEKAYPMDHYTHQVQREAYAAALRDDAARDERISENAKLRALVQELVNCIGIADKYGQFREQGPYHFDPASIYYKRQQDEIAAIATAKEAGFTPTTAK